MGLIGALPPRLYEIINCGIATTCTVALAICVRYLATEYRNIQGLLRLKLAVGFTVFLIGESIRMGWVWLARYLANTAHDPSWMGHAPAVFLPIAASIVSIIGMACVIRALAPQAWGRVGYAVALASAALAIVATQFAR